MCKLKLTDKEIMVLERELACNFNDAEWTIEGVKIDDLRKKLLSALTGGEDE